MERQTIRIGICDDEPIFAEQLKEIILQFNVNPSINLDVYTFSSGFILLEEVHNLDLIYLDLHMPEIDGISVGKRINVIKDSIKIIIATSMVERYKEAFYIHAFRMITKPFQIQEVFNSLQDFIQCCRGFKEIRAYRNRKEYHIFQKDIEYIIAYDSYVEIYANGYFFRKETSLLELESELDMGLFFRTHRKYLVNLLHSTNIKDGVISVNSKIIPVSKRKRKQFEMAYIEFDLKMRSL